ncbi:hypothetical protein QMO56_14270 [Roseomonas sp. E05]|uniref:hypothetical protein n=1 Tax=Roseomonas sp. E05 TaxID=3046310 RepID=UPI0024BA85F8|nr:hypothetical protein [Roseomonas sp. E05]MDJ0389283.1 hypothetical protein [Roseomonas sp. E05]
MPPRTGTAFRHALTRRAMTLGALALSLPARRGQRVVLEVEALGALQARVVHHAEGLLRVRFLEPPPQQRLRLAWLTRPPERRRKPPHPAQPPE